MCRGGHWPPEWEVYGITSDQWSPMRNERERRKVCRGGHWPPEWEVYGITGDQWSPLRNEGRSVICHRTGKYMG